MAATPGGTAWFGGKACPTITVLAVPWSTLSLTSRLPGTSGVVHEATGALTSGVPSVAWTGGVSTLA